MYYKLPNTQALLSKHILALTNQNRQGSHVDRRSMRCNFTIMHSWRQHIQSRLSSLVNKQVEPTEKAYLPSPSSLWLVALVLLSGPCSAVYTEEKEVDQQLT